MHLPADAVPAVVGHVHRRGRPPARLRDPAAAIPALFTVAAIAAVLEVPLDDLVRAATTTGDTTAHTAVA